MPVTWLPSASALPQPDEIAHAAVERHTREGVVCSVSLKVNWDAGVLILNSILDNALEWPYSPGRGIRAREGTLQAFSPQIQSIADSPTGHGLKYEAGRIDLTFDTNAGEPGDPPAPESGEPQVLYTESVQPNGEHLKLNPNKFSWVSGGGGPKVTTEEAGGKLIIGLDYVCRWDNLVSVPNAAINDVSHVNVASIRAPSLNKTFQPQTLLFNAPNISRTVLRGALSLYSMECRWSWRKDGWNKFWRQETGGFAVMYYDTQTVGYKNYPTQCFYRITRTTNMIKPFSEIEEFKKGERILSDDFRNKLNLLVRNAKQENMLPGTFQNGAIKVQYPVGVGGADASVIVGSVARVTEEIEAATQVAFSALPADVQDAAGGVDDAAECLKLGKGAADILQIILGADGYIYAVPLPSAESFDIHNSSTSGTITDGDFVQYKNVEIEGVNHGLIDVAPCTSGVMATQFKKDNPGTCCCGCQVGDIIMPTTLTLNLFVSPGPDIIPHDGISWGSQLYYTRTDCEDFDLVYHDSLPTEDPYYPDVFDNAMIGIFNSASPLELEVTESIKLLGGNCCRSTYKLPLNSPALSDTYPRLKYVANHPIPTSVTPVYHTCAWNEAFTVCSLQSSQWTRKHSPVYAEAIIELTVCFEDDEYSYTLDGYVQFHYWLCEDLDGTVVCDLDTPYDFGLWHPLGTFRIGGTFGLISHGPFATASALWTHLESLIATDPDINPAGVVVGSYVDKPTNAPAVFVADPTGCCVSGGSCETLSQTPIWYFQHEHWYTVDGAEFTVVI